MDKDTKKIVRAALKRGWKLEHGKKHHFLIHPSGRKVSFSITPSDRMAHRQMERDVERVERETENAVV